MSQVPTSRRWGFEARCGALFTLVGLVGFAHSSLAGSSIPGMRSAMFVLGTELVEVDGSVDPREGELIADIFGRRGSYFKEKPEKLGPYSAVHKFPLDAVSMHRVSTMSMRSAKELWLASEGRGDAEDMYLNFLCIALADEVLDPKEIAWLRERAEELGLKPLTKESLEPYLKAHFELPVNLRAIRAAQSRYDSTFDVWKDADIYPPSSGEKPAEWDKDKAGGFTELGWEPEETAVFGSYWVTSTQTNYTVYGISDLDGDGEYATYTATKSVSPTKITPIGVK